VVNTEYAKWPRCTGSKELVKLSIIYQQILSPRYIAILDRHALLS
jgi:hypothetical protein